MSQVLRVYRNLGVKHMLLLSISYVYDEYIRSRTPKINKPAMVQGVEMSNKKATLLEIFPFFSHQEYTEYLFTELIRRYTKEGDNIVIVGGGEGITATLQARSCGPKGSAKVFEAQKERVELIRDNFDLNNVAGWSSVVHCLVKSDDSSGRQLQEYDGEILSPKSLPECDVLELDCEGAEVEILSEMESRPRDVFVETHGVWDGPKDEVCSLLKSNGYEIRNCWPHIPEKGIYIVHASKTK